MIGRTDITAACQFRGVRASELQPGSGSSGASALARWPGTTSWCGGTLPTTKADKVLGTRPGRPEDQVVNARLLVGQLPGSELTAISAGI
jgi:hypothetical protein